MNRLPHTSILRGALAACVLFLGIGCCPKSLSMEGPASTAAATAKPPCVDVTAPEDLMREHGVLRRVLLMYDECVRRLESGQTPPAGAVADSADIIRAFIEDYHEKLEEDYLFTQFDKAGVEVQLVATLRAQHAAGRKLTAEILLLSDDKGLADPARRARLARRLAEFCRMYRPHAAREDTVLFPAIRRVFTPEEFDKLEDTFEDLETKMVGQEGFEHMVKRVTAIEKRLGIERLDQFSPTP